MGYALEIGQDLNAVALDIHKEKMVGMNLAKILTYIDAKCVTWMENHLGSSAYGSINTYNSDINTSSPGWFRTVLRVGFIDDNGNGILDSLETVDCHWWYQTNEDNGIWADKHGTSGPSTKEVGSAGIDPATITWSVEVPIEGTLYYSSIGKYYQIKDIRSIPW